MENQISVVESYELSPVGQATRQFELVQRMAQAYSISTMVPQQYTNNIGNCVIAIDLANRMGANPLMVMQNLNIIHNKPSFSASFLIATINACGRFLPIHYEFKGTPNTKDWGCRVYTYDKSDTERKFPLYGAWVTMKMAEDEGWTKKAGSKWLTMPELMLQYRASAFWQRTHAPELSLGFLTTEEEEDIQDIPYQEIKEDKREAMKKETIAIPNMNIPEQQPTQQDELQIASAESAPF